MAKAKRRRFVQSDEVGTSRTVGHQYGKENAAGVPIGTPQSVGQNGPLAKAISATLARTIVIAGSIARSGIIVAVTSDIGRPHPATFPISEERTCQHKCCHHNGN